MRLSSEDEQAIRAAFDSLMNLEPTELKAWMETAQSLKVGMTRCGETETVGRQSRRKILAIRAKPPEDLTDADYAHMLKVIGYYRRHLAQRPQTLAKGATLPTPPGAGA
jgi:hypothetical protein